ncbi:sensor histidine kinase [Amphibacillus cookii]|uniref:sensor histidine kinase n=1 Tax=Amphibacillus cookii TaxID=767787 RepID=UPI0019569F82|nr:HAMP domain-containing sensor histidine kinase [Amphibacillus cookii]MBM7541431.1 signal transduction histidine kinase [Amphibacillus cookii]
MNQCCIFCTKNRYLLFIFKVIGGIIIKNRIAIKIAISFFIVIFIIQSILFITLYNFVARDERDEAVNQLWTRGHSHSKVLSEHFNEETIEHVALMESASPLIAIILDHNYEILAQSNGIESEVEDIILNTDLSQLSQQGKIINSDWLNANYLATVNPIQVDQDNNGFIFMFTSTEQLKGNIQSLAIQFTVVGILSLLLTIMTLFILSRKVSKPLLDMKAATQMLSKNQTTSMMLPVNRNDELGELADAITSLANHLTHLKNERNEFLASIAHELRTPLTYIKGYADILTKQNTLTDLDRDKYLRIIQEESDRLTLLIKNLFELAQADQNKFTISTQRGQLHRLVSDVIQFFQVSFQERGITLTVNIPKEIELQLDQKRFKQVLIIVIDNCLKHAGSPFDHLKINAENTDHFIVLAIEDNGQGIDQDHLPYIFDKLYRADQSRARKSGGSGLGLAIAKQIVTAHNGEIEVHSTRSSGTKTIIKLRKE